jgi:hypothetical protein
MKDIYIDSEDSHLLYEKWYVHSRGYVVNRKGELMHHKIIGKPPKGYVVDHKNGDKFDNRRANLQIITNAQNVRFRMKENKNNTSGFRGVSLRPSGRWVAIIWYGRKKITLGTFDLFEDAVAARLEGEVKYGYIRT